MPQEVQEALRQALLQAIRRAVSIDELACRSTFADGVGRGICLQTARRLALAAGYEPRVIPKPQPDRRRRTRKKEARR